MNKDIVKTGDDRFIQDKKTLDAIMADKKDYKPSTVKKVLRSLGLSASENVTVKNPVTGKETDIVIHRDGTPLSKLQIALADPNLTRDRKDHEMSMYLWERGKESSSMMVDLMRYKGQHTKETRAFTSQMRFDFETFVTMFSTHLNKIARTISECLNFSVKDTYKEFEDYLKKERAFMKEMADKEIEYTPRLKFVDFMSVTHPEISITDYTLMGLAIDSIDTASLLEERTKSVTENRMKQRGYGIYINSTGRPYTIFDKDIVDMVQQDIDRLKELEEDEKTL